MAKKDPWRPTKYSPELLEKAEAYIDDFASCGDVIPSIEGLAPYLNVSRTCIYTWRDQEDKKDFSYILDKILSKQAQLLINEGLKGEFNAAITKLALGKHGYHEKIDSDVTSKGKEIKNNFIIQPVTTKNG